jgi:hypothetical protein
VSDFGTQFNFTIDNKVRFALAFRFDVVLGVSDILQDKAKRSARYREPMVLQSRHLKLLMKIGAAVAISGEAKGV